MREADSIAGREELRFRKSGSREKSPGLSTKDYGHKISLCTKENRTGGPGYYGYYPLSPGKKRGKKGEKVNHRRAGRIGSWLTGLEPTTPDNGGGSANEKMTRGKKKR